MSNELTSWDVYSDMSDDGGNDSMGSKRINEATKLLFLKKYASSNIPESELIEVFNSCQYNDAEIKKKVFELTTGKKKTKDDNSISNKGFFKKDNDSHQTNKNHNGSYYRWKPKDKPIKNTKSHDKSNIKSNHIYSTNHGDLQIKKKDEEVLVDSNKNKSNEVLNTNDNSLISEFNTKVQVSQNQINEKSCKEQSQSEVNSSKKNFKELRKQSVVDDLEFNVKKEDSRRISNEGSLTFLSSKIDTNEESTQQDEPSYNLFKIPENSFMNASNYINYFYSANIPKDQMHKMSNNNLNMNVNMNMNMNMNMNFGHYPTGFNPYLHQVYMYPYNMQFMHPGFPNAYYSQQANVDQSLKYTQEK